MNPMIMNTRRRSPLFGSSVFASTDLAEIVDAFMAAPPSTGATPSMPIDVHEDAEGITVVANVPGFAKDEVGVEFHEGVLTLSAMRTVETTNDAAKGADSCCGSGACCDAKDGETSAATPKPRVRTVIRERSVSAVRRALQLPDRVTGEGIVAELENGVLTVRLPYAARPTPRKISVN